MGSPLGPLFANAFMSNFETKHMSKLKELGLKRWWRYVDDVFASLESQVQAELVLKILNDNTLTSNLPSNTSLKIGFRSLTHLLLEDIAAIAPLSTAKRRLLACT